MPGCNCTRLQVSDPMGFCQFYQGLDEGTRPSTCLQTDA